MEKAVETAYKAVMKPKEGTILTVAKGAAEKAAELAPESEDLNAFIEAAKAAPGQLKALPDTRDAAGIKRGRRCGFRRTGSLNRTAGRI